MKKLILLVCLALALPALAQFKNSRTNNLPYSAQFNSTDVLLMGRPGGTNYNVAVSNLLSMAAQANTAGTINMNSATATLASNVTPGLSFTNFANHAADWLVPNTNIVDVNMTNKYVATANWLGGTANYWVNYARPTRIRQSGKIANVEVIIGTNLTSVTGFYFDLWRFNAAGTLDVVYSENILSKLVGESTNTVTLATDVYAQSGDIVGGHWTASAAKESNFTPAVDYGFSGASYDRATSPGTAGINWLSGTTARSGVIPFIVRMQAPSVVFLGDSTVAGSPAATTFLQWTVATNQTGTMPNYFAQMLGVTHQNLGVGSFRIDEMGTIWTNNALPAKPKLAVMTAGLNDLNQSVSQATYLTHLTNILRSARDNNIKVLWTYITPWSSGSASVMTNRDLWNAAAKATCATFTNVICVANVEQQLGVFRSGGSPGNFWDVQLALSPDGVHYYPTGYYAYAQGLASNLLPVVTPTLLATSNLNVFGEAKFPGKASGNFAGNMTGNSIGLTNWPRAEFITLGGDNYVYLYASNVITKTNWTKARFNTTNYASGQWFSVDEGVITVLPGGEGYWKVRAEVPILKGDDVVLRLYRTNNTATVLAYGMELYNFNTDNQTIPASLDALVLLNQGDMIQIEAWVTATAGAYFGRHNYGGLGAYPTLGATNYYANRIEFSR